ncbi:MAG: branched-chain amino acid aminotransferase [Pseudomonadota bacterium]
MQSLTYYDGDFTEGNPMIMGPMDQSFWFATMIFDGARAFDGVLPDIEKHSERCLKSARIMGMEPKETLEELIDLTITMARKFPRDMQLYIRPTYWCGETDALYPDPDLTKFLLCVHEAPMEEPKGGSVMLSSFRRPAPDMAMTLAKASSLYPVTGEALREARAKGFGNAVMLDHEGHVAEFATSNLFTAKDGVVHTPVPNGTFLNGITRQRVIGQLRDTGVEVVERSMTYDDVASADEVFSTGNYSKVLPVTKVDDRDLQPGPIYRKARELYFDFARESATTY